MVGCNAQGTQKLRVTFGAATLTHYASRRIQDGASWQDDELDAIVADYFDMLAAELSGQQYVKSSHSQALMARIGRTHRSVEFKHQNISAVLDELGMPSLPGHKPKRNYQNAIFAAIDRYLTNHPAMLEPLPSSPPLVTAPPAGIFVDPPVLTPDGAPPPSLQLIGRLLGEATLIRAGAAYERATEWHTQCPPA
jgi:Asp-tRNA(Asn)/Glu-tRNA(Gln) amidotransferase A subunit family amidase